MTSLGLAFLAGLVSASGFAPFGLWPLTLAAFAVLLWLIERAPSLRSALARGWWFGFGQFVLGLNWIATAFTYQAAMPAWLGWVAVILLSLYLAVFPAAAAGLAWRWGRGHRTALVLVLAAAWIVTEWLRATVFTGFAWNPVGVALVPSGLAGLAPWIGTYGLSAIAVLLGGALLLLSQRTFRTAAATLIVIVAAGGLAWAVAPDPQGQGAAIRVVQPNIGQQNKWDPDFREENYRRLAGLTGRPSATPRLILWPEAATPDFLSLQRGARRRIASLLGPNDLMLLGGVELVFGPDGRSIAAYNSLFALDPRANLRGRYDKAHLVPYGEYLPMRPVLSAIGLSRLAPGDLDFWSGPGPQTLALPGFGRAGIQICYEIIFSGHVVDSADRPDFIFNPSNDAWFGAWGPPQHLAQARLRAIEEGLPVVRATPTGISAVIDANGRILHSLPLGTAGAIDARLPGAVSPTLFARLGNALPFAFALLLVALAIAVRRKAR
ncbi:apolipoprotein N-acyltransferase [Sphingosinicella sp. LHD-64]|uniref:apolipoprotein N-acyltransferase n=1 Tax=Sphingosinicella sp. LHD-64 TaxID=3072139 RepID=UPI00280E0DC9|nr:apolipoprotein N-acyltransferase [Sphingosinicella sp. LHD-64]MDQ8756013.1 apolipoprotein N-acyltransferase [Sphingosinicella sp. LHD-64]